MSTVQRTLALFVVSACVTLPAPTYGSGWPPDEVACAKTIGIDLPYFARPADPHYVRHLTWESAAVVRGIVKDVTDNIDGPYHTVVRVQVTSSMKGGFSENDTVYVDLLSGPAYDRKKSQIVVGTLVGEPTFATGETVLLFLTTEKPWVNPDHPGEFDRDPAHFGPAANVKWIVSGGETWEIADRSKLFPLEWVEEEILLTVNRQQQCP